MPPMADRWSRLRGARIIGSGPGERRCAPCQAASRTQTGRQRPASFLLLPPFFDLGPTLFLPSLAGCLVSLARSGYWLLAAPATGLQDAADMGWIVRDPEASRIRVATLGWVHTSPWK